MENSPSLLLTIIAFFGGFSVLVFIHEWGHYIVARIFGVKIDSFSIGFGKELVGKTDRKGVRWKICALPLGGYVKFHGDASGASNAGDALEGLSEEEKKSCFHFKPIWQRFLIVAAGPGINLLAAIIIYAGFNYANGVPFTPSEVAGLAENSAAAEAGLQVGDMIVSIDGQNVDRMTEVSAIVRLFPGQTLRFGIERAGEVLFYDITLGTAYFEDRFDNRYPYGVLGVASSGGKYIEVSPFEAVGEGVKQTVSAIDMIFTSVGQIIVGTRSVKELGGPVRIATVTGEAASLGLDYYIRLLAFVSINLGVMNLLPIPVLDGGHLMFYLIEGIKGSPLNKKAQEMGYIGGMALLLIFMVFVTMNDLQSIIL